MAPQPVQTVSTACKFLNLTDASFAERELKLLCKNVKFIPKQQVEDYEHMYKMFQFTRRVRTLYVSLFNVVDLFTGSGEVHDPTLNEISPICRNLNEFSPPSITNPYLDNVLNNLEANYVFEPDMVKREKLPKIVNDIRAKAKTNSICFCRADKGGCLVAVKKQDYKNLVFTHLNDTSTYVKTDDTKIKYIMSKVRKYCKKYNASFHPLEIDFLTNFDQKDSSFYVLPKLHKSNVIKCIVDNSKHEAVSVSYCPEDLPSRPIVNSKDSVTSRLSHFLDILLKPYVVKVKSYVKDSSDFLTKIYTNQVNKGLLVSMDVVSLYTNIPNVLGYEAIGFWISKFPQLISDRFSLDLIIDGLKLILDNNIFKYEKSYYTQIKGVAMGTKVAPTYAILTLGYLEELMYKKCKTIFADNITDYIYNNFWRFIDDTFILWPFTEDALAKFIGLLNSMNSSVSYTVEKSYKNLSFLDILVYKDDNDVLKTDIYYKATDSHNFLHFNSNHPRHIIRNIPYNQAKRISKIVSDPDRKSFRLNELGLFLKNAGYPAKLITDAISMNNVDQKIKKDENIFPIVTYYENNSSNKKRNESMRDIYKHLNNEFNFPKKMITSYCLPKNLFACLNSGDASVTKCNHPLCDLCKIIITGKQYKNEHGYIISTNKNNNCNSNNTIYCLICRNCRKTYIGQTNNLRHRINLHRNHMNHINNNSLPVSMHLNTCAKGFNVYPFFTLPDSSSTYMRLKMEGYFIQHYSPSLNNKN